MERSYTITVDGRRYEAEPGIVESTQLGYEDHGMFAVALTLRFGEGGSAQGTGHIALMGADDDCGIRFVQEVIDVAGCQTWEALRGVQLVALREEGRSYGVIRGLAAPLADRALVFERFWAEHEAGHVVLARPEEG